MNQSKTVTYESVAPAAGKQMRKLVLLASCIGFGLYSLLLAPLYTQLSVDVVYQEAVITYIVYYLMCAAEIATYYVIFPAILYAVWRKGVWGSRSVWITAVIAVICKYLLNFFMTCLSDGSLPSWDVFVRSDIPFIIPNLLMEEAQFAVLLLLSGLIIRARKSKWQTAKLLNEEADDQRALAFPISKILSFKNPLQASAFLFSLLLFLARAFMHLWYQLTLLVYTGSFEGGLVLTVDLISDLFLAGIAYFVMLLFLSSFDRKELISLANSSKGSST